MTHFRLRRPLAVLMLGGSALATTVPARAQAVDAADPARLPQAGTPVTTGPTLSKDQTSIGGPPLSDASPRLPRVDYDVDDISVPRTAEADALRGQTVLGRARPDYDPAGIRSGAFQIFPEVSVRGGYDSNVFNQTRGRGDGFVRFRGAARAISDWDRNQVELDGFVDDRLYATQSSENGLTYNVHAAGRLDVTAGSSFTAGVQRSRVFIERGATTELVDTPEPVRYNLTSAELGGRRQAGRLTLGLNGLVSQYAYDDTRAFNGIVQSQRFRDSNVYRGQVDVGYATGPGPELFTSLTVDVRRFRYETVPNRDSDGFELLGGVRGNITPLLRGSLGAGFLHYRFKDASIANRNGLGLNVQLDYLLTELTTITASGRRELRNVSSATAPAALTTSLTLGVNHELLRNLIVSALATADSSTYVASPIRVRRYGGDLGGQYLVNRLFRFDANIAYRKRDQLHTTLLDRSEVIATVGVTAHL